MVSSTVSSDGSGIGGSAVSTVSGCSGVESSVGGTSEGSVYIDSSAVDSVVGGALSIAGCSLCSSKL